MFNSNPDEATFMSMAVVQRIREGSIPPDDAYWWTRIVCSEYKDEDGVIRGRYVDHTAYADEAVPEASGMTVAVISSMANAFAAPVLGDSTCEPKTPLIRT